MTFLILAAALLATLYLVRFCYQGPSWPKTLVKTLSVALLALGVLVSGGPVWLIAALGLCAAGDYFLSRDTDATFMAGIAAFAAGHLGFAGAFLSHDLADPALILSPRTLPLIAGLAVFGPVMAWLLFTRAGALRFAVMGYIPIILIMAVTALAVPGAGSGVLVAGPLIFILPAALLFLLSDTVLALQEFVIPTGHRLHRLTPFVVWPTYWLAQFGFFWGLFWGS